MKRAMVHNTVSSVYCCESAFTIQTNSLHVAIYAMDVNLKVHNICIPFPYVLIFEMTLQQFEKN